MFKTKTQIPKNLNSLELMRQNNFRIFKEHRANFHSRREATHALLAMHVSPHVIR